MDRGPGQMELESESHEGRNHVASATPWIGIGIIGIVIWIAIAFWPARVAGRKGHSFFGFFLLSLLFFPLSLILAYMADDRTVNRMLT